MTSLLFAPVQVPRADFVEAARRFIGVPYSAQNTCYFGPGEARNRCDCTGLLLLAAREVGWLPPDFDCNLPPSAFEGQNRATSLKGLLSLNTSAVPKHEMQPGDVLMMRWKDETKDTARHVALLSNLEPTKFIQACEDWAGHGKVHETFLDGDSNARIVAVYRIRNIV